MALAWAVLVCLTAIQFVGAADDDAPPAALAGPDAVATNIAIAPLD